VNAAFCPESSGPFKVAVTVAPPALLVEYLELTARVTPLTSRARMGAAEGTKASLNTTVRACEKFAGREHTRESRSYRLWKDELVDWPGHREIKPTYVVDGALLSIIESKLKAN
jgi:hypothetical protein